MDIFVLGTTRIYRSSSGVLPLGGFTQGFCPETLKYCRDFTCTRWVHQPSAPGSWLLPPTWSAARAELLSEPPCDGESLPTSLRWKPCLSSSSRDSSHEQSGSNLWSGVRAPVMPLLTLRAVRLPDSAFAVQILLYWNLASYKEALLELGFLTWVHGPWAPP